MPSDLMTLSLTGRTTTPASIDAVELRCIQTSDRDALATAYLVSCVSSSFTVWDDGACHHLLWRSVIKIA